MEETQNRLAKDLCLAESNSQHNLNALPEVMDRKIGFGKLEIPDDPADGICKNACSNQQGKGKDQLSGHPYFDFISLSASTSFGSTFNASPTMPYCAASKTGASLSVLTATIYLEALTPAMCCVAPEIPNAK